MESVHYKIQVNSVSYETDAPTNNYEFNIISEKIQIHSNAVTQNRSYSAFV